MKKEIYGPSRIEKQLAKISMVGGILLILVGTAMTLLNISDSSYLFQSHRGTPYSDASYSTTLNGPASIGIGLFLFSIGYLFKRSFTKKTN